MGVPLYYCCADVVKLADTPDLGSGAPRREGSSPFIRTIQNLLKYNFLRLKLSKGNPMGNPNLYFLFFGLFFNVWLIGLTFFFYTKFILSRVCAT